MKIIGHRGARGLAPENTLLAIKHALDHQADEIEFDIRVTKDGIPILHHNASIDNGGVSLSIAKHTFEQLQIYKNDLTLLTEALDLIGQKAIPHIEIKRDEPIKPVVVIIKKYIASGRYSASDLLLGSKSQATLRELHGALPDVPKVVIESWSGTRARLRAHQLHTKRLSMKASWLWVGFLKPMHKRGYLITPYTVNNPSKIEKWRPYIYGVITDYPDRFVK